MSHLEDAGEFSPARDDISPGLLTIPCTPLLDDEDLFGPLLCFAFHMEEDSALPKDLPKLLWVIQSAMCHVEKGEKQAFLRFEERPFYINMGGNPREKAVIVQNEDGEAVSPLHMQIRVHRSASAFSSPGLILLSMGAGWGLSITWCWW